MVMYGVEGQNLMMRKKAEVFSRGSARSCGHKEGGHSSNPLVVGLSDRVEVAHIEGVGHSIRRENFEEHCL